jgi:hypothetical protein
MPFRFLLALIIKGSAGVVQGVDCGYRDRTNDPFPKIEKIIGKARMSVKKPVNFWLTGA